MCSIQEAHQTACVLISRFCSMAIIIERASTLPMEGMLVHHKVIPYPRICSVYINNYSHDSNSQDL